MRRISHAYRVAVGLAALGCVTSIASLGCGLDNAIVGGACAVPYVECAGTCILVDSDPANCGSCGHACLPGATCSSGVCADALGDADGTDGTFEDSETTPRPDAAGSTDGPDGADSASNADGDGSSLEGGEGGACAFPEIECGGICVDPTSDPNNCGSCGKVCPSNACVLGLCDGTAAGHVVAIGHDYQSAPSSGSSQARVLGNAVFMPKSSPLNILSYEHYAAAGDVTNVKNLLNGQAKKLGRTLAITSTSVDSDVSSTLDISTYDVLLVPDQRSSSSGTLKTVGAAWASSTTLDTFLHAGGVIVVLDGGTGTGEMPDFVTAMGILTLNAHTVLASPSLTDLAPGDAVGTSLISPYVPTKSTVWFDAEPASLTVTYVVGKGSPDPVVIHKVFP